MKLFEAPKSSGSVFKRFGSLLEETMDFLPETTAWFTTKASVQPDTVRQRKPQTVFNTATSFVQERESFAGQPGKLYTARSNILAIEDPVTRTQGLDFLKKLQDLPLADQQNVLAFLNGAGGLAQPTGMGGTTPGVSPETIEGLAMEGQVEVGAEPGQLAFADDRSGQSLYAALKIAFPNLDVAIEDPNTAEQILTDLSDAAIEPALESASANALADTLAGIENGDTTLVEALWQTPLAVSGVASEYTFGALGKTADVVGAEGLADQVASLWDNVEQGISDEMVGYYDPVVGEYHKGFLNADLEVDYNDPASVERFMTTTEQRGNAFGVLALFGGAAAGIGAGAVGRRVKTIRSIIGETDDVVMKSLPSNIKPVGTGALDRLANPYRRVASATQRQFDEMAVALFRVSPEKFFQESMFGRLHERGGVQLLKALRAAREQFPGRGQADLDAQVGWLRKRYGTQVPDALVRDMLMAPSVEDAKYRFVRYATNPQGPEVVQSMVKAIGARRAKLDAMTDEIAYGEDGVQWNKDLARYDELSDPARSRGRDALWEDNEGGMDASMWDAADSVKKKEMISAMEEEAELAALRRRLGFTPHTKDRTGKRWAGPPETPTQGIPGEGAEVNMSMAEVDRLADPELWDPNTSQGEGRIGKLSFEEFQALKDDIAENGIHTPLEVQVNPNTGEAIMSEGFHRWMAARELGLEEVPVKITYSETTVGKQLIPPKPRPTPTTRDLQALSRERLRIQALEEKLAHTHDDSPMIHYPKQSIIRASLRAPATRAERLLAGMLRVGTLGLDPLKFVDELPSRPTMYVPENADNPADWMDQNTTTLENVLHRVGVPRDEAAEAIGKLGRIRNSQEFYEVLEKEIFGDGGLIDRNLRPDIAQDKTLRGRLIYLHGRTPEARTRSRTSRYVETGAGRTRIDPPVLATQKGGELIPLPSRPTEFLKEVALPQVDDLIEATSIVRRVVRNAEKRGVGAVNAGAVYNIPKLLMHLQTATLKPLVMLVRLPAMGMRIQLEQSLRLAASGYRPIKGLPDGLTLFPGGIPVPFSRQAAAATGVDIPQNVRVLSGLFGEDGWNLLDPDPTRRGGSQLPPNTELGGFLEESMDHGDAEIHFVGTQELRDDPARITKHHLESHRKTLEQANTDWLDRRLAASGLDRDRIKDWLVKSRRGRQFMDKNMKPQLERSTYYADPGNPDGAIIELDAAEAARLVEFPNRLRTDNPVGRTPEQIEGLRESLRGGYDPEYVGDSGVAEGYLTLEYDPGTGKAIIREGHHRIGILAEDGGTIKVKVKVVDGTPAVRGKDIDEVSGDDFMAMLSELSPVGDSTGFDFDIAPYIDTPEIRMDKAIDQWLDARVEYIKGITREDPDLLDFVATGKFRTQRGTTVRKYSATGRNIAQDHANLSNDVTNLRAELARRNAAGDRWSGDPEKLDELTALQVTLRARERRLSTMLDEYPDELGTAYHRAGDKKAFRDALRRKWEENPDSIPDSIALEQGTYRRDPDLGLTEDMHRWAAAASSAMYRPFKALSYVDRHGTRGSLWTQAYQRSVKKYRAHGYTIHQAENLAYAEAGNVTRDLMYDLNARTSVQRALKDLFWFAPATQEVLYTWLIKIPSESYWPLGAASLLAKGRLGIAAFEEMGVISENADGEKIIKVPFLGSLIEKMSGGTVKVPDIQYGKLEGLNLVTTGGGVPGLSTLGNFTLGRAALKWGGFAKELSDIFQPYGPEASMLPQPITFLHEAVFGEAPPFEPLSGAYTKAQWDRAFDQSVQYAYHELAEDGITPPRVEDFGTPDEDGRVVLSPEQEEKYQAASQEYLTELMDLGKDYAQGFAWTRLVGSTVMPMSIYATSTEREQWDTFWNELLGEGEGSGTLSDAQRETVSDYLSEHPNSLAFSVFTTKYGAKKRDLPFAESNDDAYFDAYYTEAASTLTPDEYSHKLMAMESKRFYQAQLDKSLREISPTLDPWELLRNGAKRSAALTEYQEEWQRYLDLNPEANALLEAQTRSWAESQDIPKRSFEAERLATTLSLLKQVTPMLTGEEGIRPQELRTVQGQLSELYGNTGEFPEPSTPSAKAMGWWYENVLDPYLDKTASLYDEAEDLQSRGLDASHVYEELRVLANTPPPSYKNKGNVPSVEEFFWGNKLPAEQEAAKVAWASRPVSWLTDFQLDTVGYNVSEKGSDFLREVASFDEWFYNELETRDVASGSSEWDQWQKFRDTRLAEYAEASGPEAQALLALNEAPPITRIVEAGYGQGNAAFEDIADTAAWVAQNIEEKGYSAKSYSETAMEWKSWFYGEVMNLAQRDPEVARLLQELERSFPLDSGGYRQDVVLFEAVFFGNFNEKFIPQELALLGG